MHSVLNIDMSSSRSIGFMPMFHRWHVGLLPLSLQTHISALLQIPGFASVGTTKLPTAGSYAAQVRVLDAVGTVTVTRAELFSVEPVPLESGQSEADALESSVTDMASLAQSSSLLTSSDAVMTASDADACESEGTCPSSRRRLLASSAAYRMRIRRMLLSKMTRGSVGAEMSTESASRTLKSVRKLGSKPEEVRGIDAPTDMLNMLLSGSANLLADQLRTGGILQVVTLSDNCMSTSDWMPIKETRDNMLRGVKDSLQNVANIFVRSMTSDELPFILMQPNAGIAMSRQPLNAKTYTSPLIRGGSVIYKHGLMEAPEPTGRRHRRQRRQSASGDGVGVWVMYFSRPWEPDNRTKVYSDVFGAGLAIGGPLVPPLPRKNELHAPKVCPEAGCLRFFIPLAKPSGSNLSPQNDTTSDLTGFVDGLRCMYWNRKIWDDITCKVGIVTYRPKMNNTVLVECKCRADGFVYVDWDIPGLPPRYIIRMTLHSAQKCASSTLLFLSIAGGAFAVLIALSYCILRRCALRGPAKISLKNMHDGAKMHVWIADTRVRNMEHLWINFMRPQLREIVSRVFNSDEPTLKADFGVIAINERGGGEFWRQDHRGRRPSYRTTSDVGSRSTDEAALIHPREYSAAGVLGHRPKRGMWPAVSIETDAPVVAPAMEDASYEEDHAAALTESVDACVHVVLFYAMFRDVFLL